MPNDIPMIVAIIQMDELETDKPDFCCKIEGNQFINPKYPAIWTVAIIVNLTVLDAFHLGKDQAR